MYKTNQIEELRNFLFSLGVGVTNAEESLLEYLGLSKKKSRVLLCWIELERLKAESVGFGIGQSFLRTKVQTVLNEE